MSRWRPSVSEERWLLLAARWPEYREAPPAVAGRGAWRGTGSVARLSLAGLGVVIAAATNVVAWALHLPAPALVAGAALLTAAELLIRSRRLWASGIEEALWSCAALGCGYWLDSHVAPALLIAVVALLSGWRLGNALLVLVGALAAGWQVSNAHWPPAASWLLLAALSLWLHGFRLQRPFHDQSLGLLLCVLPAAAYLAPLVIGGARPASA
jgi:hypothetical protein